MDLEQKFLTSRVYVVDVGRGKLWLYDSETNSVGSFKFNGVEDLIGRLEPGSIFVGEKASFDTPRKTISRSQPLTESELFRFQALCKEKDIIFKIWPEKRTPAALAYSGLEKSDENDPKAIYLWLKDNPERFEGLQNPSKSFSLSPEYTVGLALRKICNARLNYCRGAVPAYTDDMISTFVRDSIDTLLDRLPESTVSFLNMTEAVRKTKEITSYELKEDYLDALRIQFTKKKPSETYLKIVTFLESNGKTDRKVIKDELGLKDYNQLNNLTKKGILNKTVDINVLPWQDAQIPFRILCTLLAPIMCPESGNVTQNELTKGVPTWNFSRKHIFVFGPNHHKGGVASSNIWHWVFPPWVKKEGKEAGFDFTRKVPKSDKPNELKTVQPGEFTKEEHDFFQAKKKEFRGHCRIIYQVYRDMIYGKLRTNELQYEEIDSILMYQ